MVTCLLNLKSRPSSRLCTRSSPDATHPDDHTATDVLLALRLLGISQAEVLPLGRSQQLLPRVRLRQQPRFYFIVRVDTNPEANGTSPYFKVHKL